MRGRHAKVGEHFCAGLDHHRRTAEIELDPTNILMIFEGFREDDFVNESGVTSPLVVVERCRKRGMETEVWVLRGELFEDVGVEQFLP